LTVPATLAGIQGPCPSCLRIIHAPLQEALYDIDSIDLDPLPHQNASRAAPPVFPEVRGRRPGDSGASLVAEKNFKARLAIPRQEEPLDDSWKDRHRDQRRRNRRAQKVGKAAQSFLESRGFQITRVALILLSGAMLAWLFQYLRTHRWQLPGNPTAVEDESSAAAEGAVSPRARELYDGESDDDTEIPPAASRIPTWQDGPQYSPVASPSKTR